MADTPQEKVGGKGESGTRSEDIFFCPACESEHEFPGHKGETVTCSACGAQMTRKSGVSDFFVCPECDSELEAPGHKGEPVMCPTCSVAMEPKHP